MWSDLDRDLALAWLIMDESKCAGCGTIPDEWVNHEGKTLVPPRYEPDIHECIGCRTRARYERSHAGKDGLPPGASVVLKRLTAEQQLEYAADTHNGPARIPD